MVPTAVRSRPASSKFDAFVVAVKSPDATNSAMNTAELSLLDTLLTIITRIAIMSAAPMQAIKSDKRSPSYAGLRTVLLGVIATKTHPVDGIICPTK
jgi:hypothetical protein